MDSLNNLKAEKSHQPEVVTDNNNRNNSSQSNIKINQSDTKDTNFEYEDNEWDLGIGDLIIDLDADIEKSSEVESSSLISPLNISHTRTNQSFLSKEIEESDELINMSSIGNSNKNLSKMDHQATLDKGLKMKIKRTKTGKTSESKHEIVKAESNGTAVDEQNNTKKSTNPSILASPSSSGKRGSSNHKKEKIKEKLFTKDLKDSSNQEVFCNCNIPSASCQRCSNNMDLNTRLNDTSTPSAEKHQLTGINMSTTTLKNTGINKQKESQKVQSNIQPAVAPGGSFQSICSNEENSKGSISPPMKRIKCDPKNMVDVCVGTSIGTITEPDCLGPCEPGTSVTLEGIVWHETEGGVLAVNVTWRGKTYVGTLIDCTKHDWAPPRFCDSPIEDLESRLQKSGRSKRIRNNAVSNELLNFTETRTSVHSKLRNGGSKVPKSDKRRKSKDESPSSSNGGVQTTSSLLQNSSTGSQSSLNIKKSKNTTSVSAVSPVLLECPEQDCSKKYKHANGLKYHQSHAHGTITNTDDDTPLIQPDSPLQSSSEKTTECSDSSSTNRESTTNDKTPENPKSEPPATESQENQAGTQINLSINEDPMPHSGEDTFTESAVKSASSSNEDSKLEKTEKSTCFGIIQDFEQISNDSLGESSIHNSSSSFYQAHSQGKSNNINKVKRNRKSPVLDTAAAADTNTVNRSENVHSPAYSDISDDSNTLVENNVVEKSKSSDANQDQPNNLMLGSYNSISYYQQPSFLQSSDSLKPSSNPSNLRAFENEKPKEQQNPLEFIGKLQLGNQLGKINPDVISNSPVAANAGKVVQHFPYNLMHGNYPFSVDNSFGTEEVRRIPLSLSKEEQNKDPENLVTDTLKQKTPLKPIIKTEVEKEPEPSVEQPQSSSAYQNFFPRHALNHPSSSTREEDIQRRPNNTNTGANPVIKEENLSQLSSSNQPGSFQVFNQQNQQKQSLKILTPSKISSSSKDIKTEEKEPKVKQEGQKPTMETQGPPPPPTSQYYLPYSIGAGNGPPFFADPIYRNMIVPPYNSPYHLQMARFSSPEDLSRNTNTKALDLLQQHASQYYNTHKIHELSERVNQLKGPSPNIKMQTPGIPGIPSPNINSQGSNTSAVAGISSSIINNNTSSNSSAGNNQVTPNSNSNVSNNSAAQLSVSKVAVDRNDRVELKDSLASRTSNSPPTQRHVHTHHHTHVVGNQLLWDWNFTK